MTRRYAFGKITGKSEAMQNVYNQLERVGGTETFKETTELTDTKS